MSTAVVCVDLDGTLIAGDLLWESFMELAQRRPLHALKLLLTLWRGKAHFKREIARCVPIDASTLPYRDGLLRDLRELHRQGTPVVLATASTEEYARRVADHLGIFTEVLASDDSVNLSGSRKAHTLVERYGQGRFDYFGNDWSDVPVWRVANRATAVAAPPRLVRRVAAQRPIECHPSQRPNITRAILKAIRPYQWVKNLLVFVPVLAAHHFFRLDLWVTALLTFIVFSLCASAIYVVNDILDIKADRLHHRKKFRPFAAGHLSVPIGLVLASGLFALGIAIAAVLISNELALVALGYVAATTLYSFYLKRRPVVDVFALTGLYVLRLLAGGIATSIPTSSWLLAFGLFFFLSLAFIKRYAEVVSASGWIRGRGYKSDDANWMQQVGLSSGYMAVLVLALYVTQPEVTVLYSRPQVLWMLCPLLLYWLTRLWLRAGRGLVHDDPIIDAMSDRVSYMVAVLGAVIALGAI